MLSPGNSNNDKYVISLYIGYVGARFLKKKVLILLVLVVVKFEYRKKWLKHFANIFTKVKALTKQGGESELS